MSESLLDALGDTSIVVCTGSGGVGKTTVSAALGVALVRDTSQRVLVLTIDPARRLATALGMPTWGGEPRLVEPSRLRRAGLQPHGQLVVAMLDMKSTWDRLVERLAPTRQIRDRILANRFYQGISTTFVGSQAYMAMEALYEFHVSGEYDCIVVDTPPSRDALDILEAPQRMTDMVGARVLAWLSGPSRVGWRAVNFAAAPFVRMADRLLGGEVLAELAAFVGDMQQLYAGMRERGAAVHRLLRAPQTGFIVVTTPEPQPFAEAETLCARLRDQAMPLRAVVVNRVLPDVLRHEGAAAAARAVLDDPAVASWFAGTLGDHTGTEAARRIAEGYLLLHQVAERHARQVGQLGRLGRVPVHRLPVVDREVADLATLTALAALIG
jgi:anion-transporting  ArsA/GET3 family ATPase